MMDKRNNTSEISREDSLLFENPFKDGGKLSRDAEDIIIAIKTGKLSVASNSQDTLHETAGKEEDEMNASLYNNPQTPTKSSPGSPISLLVKPCNRKNAVIENNKTPQTNISSEKNNKKPFKKNPKCCNIS